MSKIKNQSLDTRQLFVQLVAQNCFVPGYATLVGDLLHGVELVKRSVNNVENWKDYGSGMNQQLCYVPNLKEYVGKTIHDFIIGCEQWDDVLFVSIKQASGRVMVLPETSYTIKEGDSGYAIVTGGEEQKQKLKDVEKGTVIPFKNQKKSGDGDEDEEDQQSDEDKDANKDDDPIGSSKKGRTESLAREEGEQQQQQQRGRSPTLRRGGSGILRSVIQSDDTTELPYSYHVSNQSRSSPEEIRDVDQIDYGNHNHGDPLKRQPIVLCGNVNTCGILADLVLELRRDYWPLVPIVILHPLDLLESDIEMIASVPHVYYIKGSPLEEVDARRAGCTLPNATVLLLSRWLNEVNKKASKKDKKAQKKAEKEEDSKVSVTRSRRILEQQMNSPARIVTVLGKTHVEKAANVSASTKEIQIVNHHQHAAGKIMSFDVFDNWLKKAQQADVGVLYTAEQLIRAVVTTVRAGDVHLVKEKEPLPFIVRKEDNEEEEENEPTTAFDLLQHMLTKRNRLMLGLYHKDSSSDHQEEYATYVVCHPNGERPVKDDEILLMLWPSNLAPCAVTVETGSALGNRSPVLPRSALGRSQDLNGNHTMGDRSPVKTNRKDKETHEHSNNYNSHNVEGADEEGEGEKPAKKTSVAGNQASMERKMSWRLSFKNKNAKLADSSENNSDASGGEQPPQPSATDATGDGTNAEHHHHNASDASSSGLRSSQKMTLTKKEKKEEEKKRKEEERKRKEEEKKKKEEEKKRLEEEKKRKKEEEKKEKQSKKAAGKKGKKGGSPDAPVPADGEQQHPQQAGITPSGDSEGKPELLPPPPSLISPSVLAPPPRDDIDNDDDDDGDNSRVLPAVPPRDDTDRGDDRQLPPVPDRDGEAAGHLPKLPPPPTLRMKGGPPPELLEMQQQQQQQQQGDEMVEEASEDATTTTATAHAPQQQQPSEEQPQAPLKRKEGALPPLPPPRKEPAAADAPPAATSAGSARGGRPEVPLPEVPRKMAPLPALPARQPQGPPQQQSPAARRKDAPLPPPPEQKKVDAAPASPSPAAAAPPPVGRRAAPPLPAVPPPRKLAPAGGESAPAPADSEDNAAITATNDDLPNTPPPPSMIVNAQAPPAASSPGGLRRPPPPTPARPPGGLRPGSPPAGAGPAAGVSPRGLPPLPPRGGTQS